MVKLWANFRFRFKILWGFFGIKLLFKVVYIFKVVKFFRVLSAFFNKEIFVNSWTSQKKYIKIKLNFLSTSSSLNLIELNWKVNKSDFKMI